MYTGPAMLFSTTLTVPAATPQASPASTTLTVARGIIHQIGVGFLDGPENEVHVIVRRPGLHQIAPTNEGDIVGNATAVVAFLDFGMDEPPYQLAIDAWSPNASYDHEIAVYVQILPHESIHPPQEALGILRRLRTAILGGP